MLQAQNPVYRPFCKSFSLFCERKSLVPSIPGNCLQTQISLLFQIFDGRVYRLPAHGHLLGNFRLGKFPVCLPHSAQNPHGTVRQTKLQRYHMIDVIYLFGGTDKFLISFLCSCFQVSSSFAPKLIRYRIIKSIL